MSEDNGLLLSYVLYTAEMLKDISMTSINRNAFPEKNVLMYCFSQNMCDECVYQDLEVLYEMQTKIGKDKVLLLPMYETDRKNQIVLKNRLNKFRYLNIPANSLNVPIFIRNDLEQRYFVFTDENGGIRSIFFPQKNNQILTRIYLDGVRSKIRSLD